MNPNVKTYPKIDKKVYVTELFVFRRRLYTEINTN